MSSPEVHPFLIANSCSACPVGKVAPSVLNDETSCICSAGSFSSPGSTICQLCAIGTCSAAGSASCSTCSKDMEGALVNKKVAQT